jgi:hypothetical protein
LKSGADPVKEEIQVMSSLNPDVANNDFSAKIKDETALAAGDGAIALNPEQQWAARIRPHLEAGVAGFITAGLELIQAKRDLKKQRDSFIHMVEAELGENIDAVEKWMAIARNPFLADSANLRNLPTAWTTLYVLSPLKPSILAELAETGRLNPALTGAAATVLVRTVRGRNDHRGGGRGGDDRPGAGSGGDDGHADGDAVGGGDDGHADGDAGGGAKADAGADAGGGTDIDSNAAGQVENSPPAKTAASRDDTIGADSQGELERKLARLEELEREKRQWEIQRHGYVSEVQELQAKLGPQTEIRHARRVFRQAIGALQKSEVPKILEKDRRFLRNSAVTGFLELIRSIVRDGLKVERLDLTYRPELH